MAGLQRLSRYKMKKSDKDNNYTTPVKDDSAHGADSFRMGAVGIVGEYVDNAFGSQITVPKVLLSRDTQVFRTAQDQARHQMSMLQRHIVRNARGGTFHPLIKGAEAWNSAN
jgi:hypothetical protein